MSVGQGGTTAEESLNDKLAELLRGYGLDAEAEQRIPDTTPSARSYHKLDVAVEMDYDCAVVEAEFHPARSVQADAARRLPRQGSLYWRWLPIVRAFTVVYPSEWALMPESRAKQALETFDGLLFQSVERASGGSLTFRAAQEGSVRDLAELLASHWTQASAHHSIDAVVAGASQAIEQAAGVLSHVPYLQRAHDDSDPSATCALIWLNAFLFQELLAANLKPSNIPAPHTGKSIPKPQANETPQQTLANWGFILEINWYPIFDLARSSLARIAAPHDAQALDIVRSQAAVMAHNPAVRRHDISGRIFHRLLSSRKFLATNYTTVPAAVMLAGLVFGSQNGPLAGKPILDEGKLATQLRVVDPACGSGTLLMAALQEVIKACRHVKAGHGSGGQGRVNIKPLLEKSFFGYDVVPGAQHLTNTTLSMAETTQVLSGLHIYVMPHDVLRQKPDDQGTPRLGSLDFLKRAPNHANVKAMELFPPAAAGASRVTSEGDQEDDVHLPQAVDLFICNPPYTRAGGPGRKGSTKWNPVFGSALSSADANMMQKAMRKTLTGTIGSLYAGLGSAFVALIDQEIGEGCFAALVLPLAAVTGSRWRPVREKLLSSYRIDWVVVSHDTRHRTKRVSLPGRLWVSFSELTRIAEVLVIAAKTGEKPDSDHRVKFVNLRRNPDDPADAMAVTRALLRSGNGQPISARSPMLRSAINCPHPEHHYGEIISVPQESLSPSAWEHVAFTHAELTEAVLMMRDQQSLGGMRVPVTPLGSIGVFGPAEGQIKGKRGLFDCAENAPGPLEIAALWHHKSGEIKKPLTEPNAVLTRRAGRAVKQDDMLQRSGRLHLARDLRHAPQRLAAVVTSRAVLGVRSWITLTPKRPRGGWEEAMCLWLNTTPGMLLRIVHANRPYLGRSSIPHELARIMPVLNADSLTDGQLQAASDLFDSLGAKKLKGFSGIGGDPTRQALNDRFVREVLGGGSSDVDGVRALTAALAAEPTMTTRH